MPDTAPMPLRPPPMKLGHSAAGFRNPQQLANGGSSERRRKLKTEEPQNGGSSQTAAGFSCWLGRQSDDAASQERRRLWTTQLLSELSSGPDINGILKLSPSDKDDPAGVKEVVEEEKNVEKPVVMRNQQPSSDSKQAGEASQELIVKEIECCRLKDQRRLCCLIYILASLIKTMLPLILVLAVVNM